MEERERFELLNDNFIYDNKLKEYVSSPNATMKHYMGTLLDLLNQQDKRIKELENSNQKLQDYYWDEVNKLDESYNKDLEERLKKIEILKQSQKQLAISELEKVRTKFNGKRPIDELASEIEIELGYTATQINNFVENQIEKLKNN